MKLKTNKASLKRIKITGTKKIMRRHTQGLCKAKNSGNGTRQRRKTKIVSSKIKTILK